MSQNLTESLFNSMSMIAGETLSKAGYDRTIQATVLKCIDSAKGKYSIKYQDSFFYAYATNPSVEYSNNAQVYILIPGNDMSKHKTIIGAVKNEGINNNFVIPESARYVEYGTNLIELKQDFGLCSYYSNSGKTFFQEVSSGVLDTITNPKERYLYEYNEENQLYNFTNDETKIPNKKYYYKKEQYGKNVVVLYSAETDINLSIDDLKDYIIETDKVKINLAGIKEFITNNEQTDSLKIGGIFKTSLPSAQQQTGNYGLKFTFVGYQDEEEIQKEFSISVEDMTGDPYRYYVNSEQVTYLNIEDFKDFTIKEILFYEENFPVNAEDISGNEEEQIYNNDIFLKGVIFQGCEKLSQEDLLGTYLRITTPQGNTFFPNDTRDKLTINAEVWDGGRPVSAPADNLCYYWFEEQANVTKYINENELNPYYDNLGGDGWACLSPVISTGGHSADSNILSVGKPKMYQKKYMSVAVYNAQKMSKEIVVTNLDAKYKIEVITDVGRTLFSKNENGDIRIKLKIYYRENSTKDWSENLPINIAKVIWKYKDEWGNYRTPNRISPDNKEVTISLGDFNQNFKLFCDVTLMNGIEGSTSIVLRKTEFSNEPFTLEIINPNGTFIYDESGISPTNEKNKSPVQIQPLTYQIFDNRTKDIIEANTLQKKARWIFPNPENSLINSPDENSLIVLGNEVLFTIDDKYQKEYNNNTIGLEVDFRGLTLRTSVNIECLKEGENGTNGTGYSIKIIPIEEDDGGPWLNDGSYFPIVPFKRDGEILKPNNRMINSHWFDVVLYFEGKEIFRGSPLGNSKIDGENSEPVIVKWEFKKHTNRGWEEDSLYSVTEEGAFSIADIPYYRDFTDIDEQYICHILQVTVTYKNQEIIASQPIGTLIEDQNLEHDTRADIYIKKNTGFQEVIYRADGTSPQYTSLPFVFMERESVNENEEEVQDRVIDPEKISWSVAGVYKEKDELIKSNDLYIPATSEKMQVKPASQYSGFCLTNAIVITIPEEGIQMHLPIHFYLNRYANKAINGWDGNSININDEDGVILTPQIGAGKKELDNSFTGMLMGVSKTNKDEDTAQEIGLFGFSHGRRSLFLNSKNGEATFGIDRVGSIKISPSINEFGESVGQPKIESGNYKYSKQDGAGLSISFGNRPYIHYGNQQFMVDENGKMTANGATITGKFKAQNLNSWDDSKILIGADNENESSEILLYGYNQSHEKIFKTHIKPGTFNLSSYEPGETTPKSYLKFDGRSLALQGNFRSKNKSSDVSFQEDSKDTYIHFKGNSTSDIEAQIESQKITRENAEKEQEALCHNAAENIKKLLKLENISEEECESIIYNWYQSYNEKEDEERGILNKKIEDLANIKILLEDIVDNTEQKMIERKELIAQKKQELEKIESMAFYDATSEQGQEKEEILKELSELCNSVSDFAYEQINNWYESFLQNACTSLLRCYKKQISQKKCDKEIKQFLEDFDSCLLSLETTDIEFRLYAEKIGNVKISVAQNKYELLEEGSPETVEDVKNLNIFSITEFDSDRTNFLKQKEQLRIALKDYEKYDSYKIIYEENEYQDLDQEVARIIDEDLIFDTTFLEEGDILAQKVAYAKSYGRFEEIKTGADIEIAKLRYRQENGVIYTDSKWSPSTFYFRSYEDDNGEYGCAENDPHRHIRSELAFDPKDGMLRYTGSVSFRAGDYGSFAMTEKDQHLHFDDGEGSIIDIRPGSFIIKDENTGAHFTFMNGKFSIDGAEFRLNTEAASIAFVNDPRATHMTLFDKNNGSYTKITPYYTQLKCGNNTLYFDAQNNSSSSSSSSSGGGSGLNYSGNVEFVGTHGLFAMKDAVMNMRFGTTIEDYPENKSYEGVPKGTTVTDFYMSSTGFSIKSYGEKTKDIIDINSETSFANSNDSGQDAINMFYNQGNQESKIVDYFKHEFIPEDGIPSSAYEKVRETYQKLFKDKKTTKEEGLAGFDTKRFYDKSDRTNYEGKTIMIGNIELPYLKTPDFMLNGGEWKTQEELDWEEKLENEGKEWTLKSGLLYDSDTGKFRLNGDFAVRNEKGTIYLSDDMMRIMFKKFDEQERPVSRMCISEESMYFYSFGDCDPAFQLENVNKTTIVKSNSNESKNYGLKSAFVWKGGALRIVGHLSATGGQLGGWNISPIALISKTGNAELEGYTGNIRLREGREPSPGEPKTFGALSTEQFDSYRTEISKGGITFQKQDDSTEKIKDAVEEFNNTVKPLQEDERAELENLGKTESEINASFNQVCDVTAAVIMTAFVDDYLSKLVSSNTIIEHRNQIRNAIDTAQKKIGDANLWEDSGWIVSGAGPANGIFIGADTSNADGYAKRKYGIFFGLGINKEKLDVDMLDGKKEIEIINEAGNAETVSMQKGFENAIVKNSVISITPYAVDSTYIEASLKNETFNPIKLDSDDYDRESFSWGGLNFIIGNREVFSSSIDENNVVYEETEKRYVYGTQILPNLVKTNDILLNNEEKEINKISEDQKNKNFIKYHSNSLVEILKELRETPDTISYIEGINARQNKDIKDFIPNGDLKNLSFILEEWKDDYKSYDIGEDSIIKEELESGKEIPTFKRIWQLELSEEKKGSEREVKSITLILDGDNDSIEKKINLEGFVVNL